MNIKRRKKLYTKSRFPVWLFLVIMAALISGTPNETNESVLDLDPKALEVCTVDCKFPVPMVSYTFEYLKVFTNLEFSDVATTLEQESQFNEKCKTWEPNVRDYSWGAPQVRGKTAGGMGCKDPKKLLTWKYGLYYGMKYLSICKDKAKRTCMQDYGYVNSDIVRRRMHSMYNAGNLYWKTIIENGEKKKVYRNRRYVIECEYIYWRNLEKYEEVVKLVKLSKQG